MLNRAKVDLKKDLVKAVLLVINSQGGSAIDSDGIYRAIKEYKERYHVPVFAYVDGVSFSGGYYIACAADQIFASEASVVGSIGVILSGVAGSTFFNVAKPLKEWGVQSAVISAGTDKDPMNPFRSWGEHEKENLQAIVNAQYEQFMGIVTKNRPLISRDTLMSEMGAKIYSSHIAKELGLIDDIKNSREDVLKALLVAANLDESNYQVVRLEKRGWLSDFVQLKNNFKFEHKVELPWDLPTGLQNKLLFYNP